MRPSISRCFQSRTLCPLNTTTDPVSLIVWFLKGTHPRLRFPRQRSLAFRAPRRRSTYASHTSWIVSRRDTDQRASPAGGCLKFRFSGPTLVMLESMALPAVAVIPYRVDLARGRVELLAGRLVLHAESKGLEGKRDVAGHGDAT